MTYALAKKLRDAGFPYTRERLHQDGNVETSPNLSELIASCGDDFDKLEKFTRYSANQESWWHAYMTESAFDKMGIACVRDCDGYEVGDTPEEAVALLWLLLNDKK